MGSDETWYIRWYWQYLALDYYSTFSLNFQQNKCPCLPTENDFCLISWGRIDGFGWNSMYQIILTINFLGVKISAEIVLNIYEPSHAKTYNKTCVTNKDRSDCTSTQYGSVLSLDNLEAVEGTCNQQRLFTLCRCAGWSEYLLVACLIVGFVLSWLIFLIFVFRKKYSTLHANCFLSRKFAWNVKAYFLGGKIIGWICPESG